MSDIDTMVATLRQSVDAEAAVGLGRLVREAPDRELCRINALDFAKFAGVSEERALDTPSSTIASSSG